MHPDVFRGLRLLYLPTIHDGLKITGFAILFGLDYLAMVPPTIALAADAFGKRNVGIVYGWIIAARAFGAAIAGFVAGVTRDIVGDHAIAIIVAGWMAVAAGVVALTIRRAGRDGPPSVAGAA